jgi:hypothetical protein
MEPLKSTMRVEYMVLANGAEAVEGHHYIIGGGFEAIFAPALPATHPRLSVALKVCVPYEATSRGHKLGLELHDQDGHGVGDPFEAQFESGRPPGMRAGDHHSLIIAFNFLNIQFTKYGTYSVVCLLDGSEEGRSTFRVTQATPAAGASR